ncbi:unnamed protein product [Cylicocyclus nassatus]|uniref:Uncharacterized protein n=1 Tax=Cylicocyclus nassatus TaxID=53992 RepID=A0AA36HHA7_CYLNA|nr:unnamed protein product [Cylicocyclus nassatus]
MYKALFLAILFGVVTVRGHDYHDVFRHLTKAEFLSNIKPSEVDCGLLCPQIGIVDCDPEGSGEDTGGCYEPEITYAPQIIHSPRRVCWTAKVRCEARGSPLQLRTDVEGITYIQAISNDPDRALEMTLICNKNGRYVTRLGRPTDGVYCFAPAAEATTAADTATDEIDDDDA